MENLHYSMTSKLYKIRLLLFRYKLEMTYNTKNNTVTRTLLHFHEEINWRKIQHHKKQENIYISCSNEFSSYFTISPWITIWMMFCPGNMIITSKFDEMDTFCSIWTKCNCGFIFDTKAMFWCNGAASLVAGAWS